MINLLYAQGITDTQDARLDDLEPLMDSFAEEHRNGLSSFRSDKRDTGVITIEMTNNDATMRITLFKTGDYTVRYEGRTSSKQTA